MQESFKTTFHRGIYIDESGNKDYDFVRIGKSQKQLTFNEEFLNPLFNPQWFETPFKEIRFTYPEERISENYKYLLEQQTTFEGTLSEFTDRLIAGIKKYIQINLKAGEKYLMLHSGGFDSRIISACMRDLWNEGMRFDIHFRCHQPEEPMFYEIMKREGWDKSFYSVYPGKKENYYNLCRTTMNGWHNYIQSMTFWDDIVSDESKITLITGLGGELFKYVAIHRNDEITERSNNRYLDMILQYHPDEGQWEGLWLRKFKDLLMPKWGYFYISESFRVNPAWCKFNGKTDSVRIEMARRFKYNIADIKWGAHNYSWRLTDNFFSKITKRFYSSRFYKDFGKHMKHNPDFRKLFTPYPKKSTWDSKIWSFMTCYEEIFK